MWPCALSTLAPDVARLFINTYRPLCGTDHGMRAVEAFELPPFIDGSIRREPDLAHEHPSISCLCRMNAFAPRLQIGDRIIYLTVKARYAQMPNHWRMTAELVVIERFATHEQAADWYRSVGQKVPSNCMIPGNPPEPLERSVGIRATDGCVSETCNQWDARYRDRARRNGTFLVCRPVWRELGWDAPVIHGEHLIEVLGKVPFTRTPELFDIEHADQVRIRLQALARPSCP